MTGSTTPCGLVGRDRETAAVRHLLSIVDGGRPRLAVVRGATGLGKTALVEHVLADQEVRVEHADGASWEQAVPFGVATQFLAEADVPADWCADAVSAGSWLRQRWRDEQQHTPLVAVVDDAQWADLESLRALSSAVRRMSGERVLILLVATTGSAPRNAPVEEFLARYRATTVHLDPLTPAEVRAFALRSAHVDLSVPAARRLAEHTGGNPLHIGRLLHELPDETWSDWQGVLPAPRAFAAAVEHELRECPAPARSLIESAAVLGTTMPFAHAAEVAEVEDPVAALDAACASGLLGTVGRRDLAELTFPSPLVRAAVHSGLSPLRHQQLHHRAAEVVEEERARLAHRVALAPFPDAALAAELDAFAARQAAVGAWSLVGEALVSASRLSPGRADRERRLVRAVDALVGAGDLPQAIAFAPAIESFAGGALRDAVLGYLAILLGRPTEAETLLHRAWQQCDPRRDPDTAATICQRRVLHMMARWHGPGLVRWGRRAIELTREDDPPAIESEAILGLGLAATGRIAEAVEAYDAVSAKVTPGAQAQRVQMGRGWLDLALDDPLSARRELHSATPTRYRMGSTRISLWAQAWLARTEFALGDWDDAVHTVDRAVAQLDDAGLDLVRPLVHWTGAQTHALLGNWETAEEHVALGSAGAHDYEVMLIPSCLARAQCAEARADYESVLRCLEPLVRLRPRQGIDEPGFWPWHDVHANALVVTNRVDEADAFLRPHEQLAAERGHRSSIARLGYVRGRVHAAWGDIESAKNAFATSLAQLENLPLPYERARVNFAYGQTLRRAGKRREADAVLHNARDAYAALGAQSYVQRCDRELKAGGLHGKRAASDFTRLTAQEQAVAKLVAAGMSNKQAAVELFVSVKTVQFHLTRIYGKLGLGTRAELAARFRDEPDH